MTAAIVISLIALSLTVLGLVYKISSFATKHEVNQQALSRKVDTIGHTVSAIVARVPLVEFRLGYVEKHLDLSVPEMTALNGNGNHNE